MSISAVKFLRRQLWHRVPRSTREAILFRAAVRFAPRITPLALAKEPIIVVGMLRTATGLGAAARACHDALKGAGFRVYGVDLTSLSAHDAVLSEFTFDDGRDVLGAGTVLLHVGGSLVPIAMSLLGAQFVRSKRIIAHWFWELPRVPDEWRLVVPFVHEIFVNTRFIAEAVRPVARGRAVHVVPYPLPAIQTTKRVVAVRRPFSVLVVFNVTSNFARKNPCAAILAFRRAFGDDPSARLIVKYANTFSWPQSKRLLERAAEGAGNIELVDAVMDEVAMAQLYDRADAVLSLHRSEGLGLVVIEAMQRGLPVIATDWSGTRDFLDSRSGIPIGYRLVPVEDPQGNYRDKKVMWAEPSVENAVAALRTLRADPALRAELGEAGAIHVRETFHPARFAKHVGSLLGSHRGPDVEHNVLAQAGPWPGSRKHQ